MNIAISMENYYLQFSDTRQDKSECYKVDMITFSVQTLDKLGKNWLANTLKRIAIISMMTVGKIELYNLYGELLLLSVLILGINLFQCCDTGQDETE